ncbi:MAG: glycerophosphodiester phosphodiesterase family protein [Desulfosalsimonadaceae bacterium]
MVEMPLWISHRGYKENAVENTRAAFRAAVDLGFPCLETDLRLTRDKRIVLIHDPVLDRLAGIRKRVEDMTAAELAGIRLTPLHRQVGRDEEQDAFDNRILFFEDFAAEFSGCRWVLDIKPEAGAETIRALSCWAEAEGKVETIARNAKILTWHPEHEVLAAERFPGVAFYARRRECWRAGFAVLSGQPRFGAIQPGKTYALTPSLLGIPLFRPSIVRRFHKRRAKVVAFLPPTDDLARRAAAAGFDEILTNRKKTAGDGPG